MSKKSKKDKKSNKNKNINDFYTLINKNDLIENSVEINNSATEIGYLTGAILDYYHATSTQIIEGGDEWKVGTEYEPKTKNNIPKELDEAIKTAFLNQIKKFQ